MSDDSLLRRRAVASDRLVGLAAVLGDLVRRLRKQIFLLDPRGLSRFRDQPIPLGADLCARLLGLGAESGGFLARRGRVGEQPFCLRLPSGDDVGHRPKKEPGKEPDENQDIDGLERQRPPVDVHVLNE
ncbi:MAG: hypothetical protein WBW74_17380 [Xanthobacteraceae bacterium]